MTSVIAIDDDPLFLKTIELYLSKLPDVVLKGMYSNPVDGIMAVVKQHPEVLLIDLEMPYLDGFEALATLDKRPKIIVISAHIQMPKTVNVEPDKYLDKALLRTPEVLHQAILEVMG